MNLMQNKEMFWVGKMFLKEVSCAHQGCTYLIKKYSKTSNVKRYYYVNLKKLIF